MKLTCKDRVLHDQLLEEYYYLAPKEIQNKFWSTFASEQKKFDHAFDKWLSETHKCRCVNGTLFVFESEQDYIWFVLKYG